MKITKPRFDGLTTETAARAANLLRELESAIVSGDILALDRVDSGIYDAQSDTWGPDFGDPTTKCADPDAFEPFLCLSWLVQDLADDKYSAADASAWLRRQFPSVAREYWASLGLDEEAATTAEVLTQMNATDIGLMRIGNE